MSSVRPYGSWPSPVDSATVVRAGGVQLLEVHADLDLAEESDTVYWLERRSDGRRVVCASAPDGSTEPIEWTPHAMAAENGDFPLEPGDGLLCVYAGTVYFAHNGRLFRQEGPTRVPVPLVHAIDRPNAQRFTHLHFANDSVYCVREERLWSADGSNNRRQQALVRVGPCDPVLEVGIRSTSPDKDQRKMRTSTFQYSCESDAVPPLRLLADGADFYAQPSVCPRGNLLVWVQWAIDDVPWRATELWLATLDSDGGLLVGSDRKLCGDERVVYSQPKWSPSGRLFCISDAYGFHNVHEVDCCSGSLIRNVYPMDVDLGRPSPLRLCNGTYDFQPGFGRIVVAINGKLLIKDVDDEGDERSIEWDNGFDKVRSVVCGQGGTACYVVESSDRPAAVVRASLPDQVSSAIRYACHPSLVDVNNLSLPELVRYHTGPRGEFITAAYYFAPNNKSFAASGTDAPPLLVLANGLPPNGDTPRLDWLVQYFTTRGFAVFHLVDSIAPESAAGDDDDERERPCGRVRYTSFVCGQWGVRDCSDVAAGVRHLAKSRRADLARVVVLGWGPLEAYSALCAAVHTSAFAAAIAICPLVDCGMAAEEGGSLAAHTLRALLTGEPHADKDIVRQACQDASPLCMGHVCNTPVAFFHGAHNKLSSLVDVQRVHSALAARRVPTALVTFPDESHAVLCERNQRTCIDGAYYFACRLTGLEPTGVPDTVADQVHVVNNGPK